MRPIHLSVEGLACFKEIQKIDFSGLDLFAISGPTGAGKSTLLDAILFALYGEVPRVGKQDLKEMISAARERVSVRFDFAVGERRYRIARTLRRKGSATVRLEEHDGTDFNKVLADQVRTASVEVTAPARSRRGCVHPGGDPPARGIREVPEDRTGQTPRNAAHAAAARRV